MEASVCWALAAGLREWKEMRRGGERETERERERVSVRERESEREREREIPPHPTSLEAVSTSMLSRWPREAMW